jgi:hypothetical protein
VHHIKERNKGGGNDEDNLIVICLSCHTDVHSTVPFARRFSYEELKGHRDELVKLVREGKLSAPEAAEVDQATRRLADATHAAPAREQDLSPEAVEVLLKAVNAQGPDQGSVMLTETFEGLTVTMGSEALGIGHEKRRLQAKYKKAVKDLDRCGFLEHSGRACWDVTDEGFLAADEIMVARGQSSATPK